MMKLAQTLIHKAVSEVFAAFLDSKQRCHFWFARSEEPWTEGRRMRWSSPLYSQEEEVLLKTLEPSKEITMEWQDPPCEIAIRFETGFSGATQITVWGGGYSQGHTPISIQTLASSNLYTKVLATLKVYMEYGITWDLVTEHIRTDGENLHCIPVHQSRLTGLPDFRALLERFKRCPPLQLACFDIDCLMPFNDHFGHLEGDRAITRVARCLGDSLESRDFYHIGGGEFVVLREDESNSKDAFRNAVESAQKAVEGLEIPYFHPEARAPKDVLTVRFGLSLSDLSGVSSEEELNKVLDESVRQSKL